MTRIDFHSNVPDKLAYACRLARKAYLARNKVVLITDDAATMAQLEAQMWTFSDVDFVPHVAAGHALAAVTPVLLSDTDSADLPHYDILINLSRRTPGQFERFQRLFEIISQHPDDAAAGRQRYSSYKQLAHPLTHFVAGKS